VKIYVAAGEGLGKKEGHDERVKVPPRKDESSYTYSLREIKKINPTHRCKNTLMPGDLNMFRFMIMSASSFAMSKASKAHWWRTFSKCEAKLGTAFPRPLILRMLCTPMRFYFTLKSLTQDGEGIMVDVSVT
jgi:hypothetical protein